MRARVCVSGAWMYCEYTVYACESARVPLKLTGMYYTRPGLHMIAHVFINSSFIYTTISRRRTNTLTAKPPPNEVY